MGRKKQSTRLQQLSEARKRREIEGGPGSKRGESIDPIIDNKSNNNNVTDDRSRSANATPTTVCISATPSTTRSEKKLQLYDSSSDTYNGGGEHGRTIVEIKQISELVKKFPCPQCFNMTLELTQSSHRGLTLRFSVYCQSCEEDVRVWWTSERDESRTFNVNKASVVTSLYSGMGAESFNNFCEQLDMPGLHHKSFQNIANTIYKLDSDVRSNLFHKAAQYVRAEHARLNARNLSDEELLDIAVSYDGSWLTRGHSSLVGVGCVIDVLTGLVLDAHVMSSYCQLCEQNKSLKDSNPEEHVKWEYDHLGSGKCQSNFTGSAGMMEVHATRLLWFRSVKLHKLRYTVMLSDGDAKAYNELVRLSPYGQDVTIEKEECINHVCKRLRTALRNCVTDASKRKITLGGRGHGRLTQAAIRKLCIYYTRAVRGNRTAAEMKNAIMASLYHCLSTDKKPRHHLCPPGANSWCFFNAAIANHTIPGPHKKHVHTPLDAQLLEEHLLPIYERLSDPHLLKRCELQGTQNSNESLHAVIWSKCRKDYFYSRSRVEHALLCSIGEFNFGPSFAQEMKSLYGLDVSAHSRRLNVKRRRTRVRLSWKAGKDKQSKRREKVREARQKREKELEALEGGPAYAAGHF